ncbi:MAG: GNAT family N-acetyltransferase [bacterium]
MKVTYREMQTHADYHACVELQQETWGQDFTEIVPPTILMIAQKLGGIVAGAFDENGKLVGFVFSQAGLMENHLMNWSQMLAVRTEVRGQGIGRQLKLFQRELLLERGIEFVYWTYDPLVARNAHLNLNKLGARIQSYVEEMYPSDNGSELHRGMSLDRFIVQWPLADANVHRILSGEMPAASKRHLDNAPVVNAEWRGDELVPVDQELVLADNVRVEIPKDIARIQELSLPQAAQWRMNTRRVFVHYLNSGHQVTQFSCDRGRCFYVLQRPLVKDQNQEEMNHVFL